MPLIQVYKQSGGAGSLVALTQEIDAYQAWSGITIALNGDVYICSRWNNNPGRIYKQTGGIGDFVNLNQDPVSYTSWVALAAAPNGDIWASELNGAQYDGTSGLFIKMSTSSDFVEYTQTGLPFVNGSSIRCIAVSPNGDVYVGLNNNYEGNSGIYKRTGGVGDFVNVSQPALNDFQWSCMTATSTGDIYIADNAEVYKQTGGAGDFVATMQNYSRQWSGLASSPGAPTVYPPSSVVCIPSTNGPLKNTITWDPVVGAVSYNLYWSFVSGTGTGGTEIVGVTSPYQHTGLDGLVLPYYYVVTTVDSTLAESAASAEASGGPMNLLTGFGNIIS